MLDALFLTTSMAASRAADAAEMRPKPPRSGPAGSTVVFMQMDIEKLLMITESLWEILKEKHGYSDEELIKRIYEIDMRDGVYDGKVAKQPPALCPQCNKKLTRRQTSCIYCGTPIARRPFDR